MAVNASVEPKSTLLLAGLKLTTAGVGTAEVLVGLPPPQPTRLPKHKRIDKVAHTQETNRRMHPPRLGKWQATRRVCNICWKTFSVEAGPDFSKRPAHPMPAIRCGHNC